MNTLKKLWKSVQTFGYPLRATDSYRPSESLKRRNHNDYHTAALEAMEPRLLLTTLTGNSSQSFKDILGHVYTVSLTGNNSDVVELIFVDQNGHLTDYVDPDTTLDTTDKGMDLYSVIVTSSTTKTRLSIYGEALDNKGKPTGDIYGAGTKLYANEEANGLVPIDAPAGTGSVYIGYRESDGKAFTIPTYSLSGATDTSGILTVNSKTALTNAMAAISSGGQYISGIYVLDSAPENGGIGRILVDGTVTGNVYAHGSIGTFYCGWLLTGDTGTSSGFTTQRADNFYVGGDLGNLLVRTSVGTNLNGNLVHTITETNLDHYNTYVDIHVAGRVGNITVGGSFLANLMVDNSANAFSLPSNWKQEEPFVWIGKDTLSNRADAFANGNIAIVSTADPLVNASTNDPTYIGTLGGGSTATVSGNLNFGQSYANKNDYYAVGLLAGQSITVSLTSITDAVGNPMLGLTWGIIDNEGRVVAVTSDIHKLTYKAKEAGTYRIAIGLSGDYTLNGATKVKSAYLNYDFTVSGLGTLAIGGLHASDIAFDSDHAIVATRGSIGAIEASGGISGTAAAGSVNIGGGNASYSPSDTPNITLSNGSLNALIGSTLGVGNAKDGVSYGVSTYVLGTIGTISSTSGFLGAYAIASGNIQLIDSAGDMGGKFATKKGIGVIRAQAMTLGTSETQFSADYDNTGRDGIIDLIDVKGDIGTINTGGPRITTGTGGNVRFIHISDSSTVFQDTYFATGGTDPADRGGIAYYGGDVIPPITDDSGAKISFTQIGASIKPSDKVLMLWTYGIYGTGGSVIIRVESSVSLNVSVSSGSSNTLQSAEIGQIVMQGPGRALVTDSNGIPSNPPAPTGTTPSPTASNDLTLSGQFRLDVFKISNAGGVINTITNSTQGDIVNISAGDIGAITLNGNLGYTSSISSNVGSDLNQIDVINNSFPFVQQHNGVVAGNIGLIAAGKGIGAIIASGSVGSIVANAGDVNDSTLFEGLTAPIMISGSVNSINIGEGLGAYGYGSYPNAGIYVQGIIYSVVGSDADIRGDIISTKKIQSIRLDNGSIVGATVAVFQDLIMAWDFYANGVTTPEFTPDTVNAPDYEIGNVTITGEGGVIGSHFVAADIGFIDVGSDGFGVVNSTFGTPSNGVLGGIRAGGLGLVDLSFSGYRIGYLIATGNGSAFTLGDRFRSVRLSESLTVDPYTGQNITDENPDSSTFTSNLRGSYLFNDLTLFLDQIGLPTYYTGMILYGSYQGAYGVSTITAYGISNATFDFANAIGNVTVTKDISNNSRILTGTINSLTVGGDFKGSSLQVAGEIRNVVINGNLDASSLIYGKGSSSSIGTLIVKGNFAGTLIAAGNVSTLNIGDAKSGAGTLSGTVQLLGTKAAGNVNFYGTVDNGASIEIEGDVSGTLRFTKGFDGALTINGNVKAIVITPDAGLTTGMTGDIAVNGNLTSMTVTGAMSNTASLTVQGDLGSFLITDNDTATDGNLLAGKILVGGAIAGVTINGDSTKGGSLTGTIQAAKAVGTITVNNGDVTSAAVIKSLMAGIAKISVTNGIIDGTVDADGAIGVIELKLPSSKVTARTNGSIGANADITGASLTTLTVPGNIKDGAVINLTGSLGTTNVKGDIENNAAISASSIGKTFTVTGNMDGDLTLSQVGVVSTININGTFGDSGSTATLTTAGSLKLTVNGIFDSTSVLRVGGNLVSLIAKNAADGTIIVNGTITSLSAASMTGAVVTAGVNIDKLTVTGALNNSLVQAGITAGNDGTFGTADANEKTTMGAIGAVSVGSLTNSVIAAGGAINSLTSKGVMTNSSASSGLVYNGTKIQTVIGDATPLASDAEIQALRIGGTLYHGNFNTVSINGGKADGLINSALTAGVSAGANGIFEASDTTDAPGMSTFKSVKALMPTSGNTSVILAETTSAPKAVNGGPVTGSANHSVSTTGLEVLPTSHVGNKYVFTIGTEVVTITVSTGVTVKAFDSAGTPGVLDSLLISSTSAAAGSVKVVATNPNALSIGQVLAGDDVNLGTFTFNGDIVGVTGQPAVQIDSNMTTFSVRNLLNSDTSSIIGGDVSNLTIGQMGSGTLTVAGAVKSLKVTTNANGGDFVANSFGAITLGNTTSTSDYIGDFTALLGGTVNSIGSIVINGTGKFTSAITAAGSIGTIAAAKASFENAIISASGDVKSITLTAGKMDATSSITVGGTLGALSIKGDLDGTVHANTVGTLTVSGNLTYVDSSHYASIQVDNAATKITIGGNANGTLTAGTIGTLAITGNVSANSHIRIAGDVGSLTVTGGTATGSYIFVDGTITGLKVSGTHAGTIATGIGGNVGTATFATVTSGALVVAGDLVKLIVTGDATSSLFSAGVYIGVNGLYNDSANVVYGGKIGSASFSGTYRDSILAAGVLPRLSGSTGIPADGRDYIGNANGSIDETDPATTGGITMSTIGRVTFAKKVESTNGDGGHMAVVVAADDITPLTYKGTLFSRIIGNPSEQLTVKSATLADTNKIEIIFSQPIDSSTINSSTVKIKNSASVVYGSVSYAYGTRTATDGSTQYVLTITNTAGDFNTSTTPANADTVTLQGGVGLPGSYITNHVGSRSAKVTLLSYVPFNTITNMPVTVPA